MYIIIIIIIVVVVIVVVVKNWVYFPIRLTALLVDTLQ